jgi:ElaB/YqjD/DUF883 family membrane-anchored ribosome-binding protein
MAAQPDQLRADIEATRTELAGDVDRIADRTNPRRIAQRRWDGLKSRLRGANDRVMGPPANAGHAVRQGVSDATDRVQETAQNVVDAAKEAPALVNRQTRGNPMAAGMIAFGVGLLAATLIPRTEAERRAGERLAEQADTVLEPLKDSGRQLGQELRGSLEHAAEQVKETASDAARSTAERASESGQDAMRQARKGAGES